MNKRMEELEAVAKKINGLSKFILEVGENSIEYDIDGGKCYGIGLLSQAEISVQKAFMSKGSIFPKHNHEVSEWLLVYEGKLLIDYCDETQEEISVGEAVHFLPGKDHRVIALEDTKYIGIVIPTTGGYPDARSE